MKRTLALLFSLLALLFGAAFAQKTPADTQINNIAEASYRDSNNQIQTAKSNEVVTVVQKVYSLSITPNSLAGSVPTADESAVTTFGQTKEGLSEGELFLDYVVTNNTNTEVNGADRINLEGVIGALGDLNLTVLGLYEADGTTKISADPSSPDNEGYITLGADGQATIRVKVELPALAQTDNNKFRNLNLTASFADASTVSDSDNWAQVVAKKPEVTLAKSASKTAVVPGDTITYTLLGENTADTPAYAVADVVTVDGTDRSGLLITDNIPAGLIYAGNVTKSPAGAVVIYSVQNSAAWTTTAPTTLSDVDAIGLLIEGTGAFFSAGTTYSLTFDVQVPANAPAATTYSNTATLQYDANGDGVADDNDETFTTPPVTSTVGAVYSVAVGPQGEPDTNGLSVNKSYTDPVSSDTWDVTLSGGYTAKDDTQTITSTVYMGDTVAFLNTIKNLSNAADTYTLTASSAAGNSDNITLFKVETDGSLSPLNSGVSVPAGDTLDVVVKVAVPVGGAADTVTLTATSTSTASESDVTLNKIPTPQVGFTFEADESGTVTYSGAVTYIHTLTNNANTAATVTIPAPAVTGSHGWAYAYWEEGNDYSLGDDITVPANGSVIFTVTVTVPAPTAPAAFDALVGEAETATFTATATYSSSANTLQDSVEDTTTVIGGSLSLRKSVVTFDGAKAAPTACDVPDDKVGGVDTVTSKAKPGDFLCYTIVAKNKGDANSILKRVVVSDKLDTYTTFVSVSAVATGYAANQVLYSNDDTNWSTTAVPPTAPNQTVYVAVNTTNGDTTITDDDTMPQNATLTVTFVVKVK